MIERFRRTLLRWLLRSYPRPATALAVAHELAYTPAQHGAIHCISELLDRDQFDEARRAIDALARELGDDDTEVVHARTMLHFLEAP